MTVAFNEAAFDRTLAASDIAQASRDLSSDRATFSSFVLALGSGDTSAADILFEEFRDEVQPLIEEWLEQDPLNDLSVQSPFDDPRYSVFETLDEGIAALEDAEIHTTAALEARSNVGNYTLTTVLFAVVLFLAGLSRQFGPRVALVLSVVGGVALVVGLGVLVALPTLF